MIVETTAYGVMITDEFGGYLNKYSDLVDAIYQEYYTQDMGLENVPEWIATEYSVEKMQLVIGFPAVINKKTDFKQLDSKWFELMKNVPEKFKEFIKNLPEPDVVEMQGEI